MAEPFLSFYTPTYRRPQQLAACIASIQNQTRANRCEQIIVPDFVGVGVGGMFAAVPRHASNLHGEYVHFLCDDDVLAGGDVVRRLEAIVDAERDGDGAGPDIVIVGSQKPGGYFPHVNEGPPVLGSIDLGCIVVHRRNVWNGHCSQFGRRYEGDYDFVAHLWAMTEAVKNLDWSAENARGAARHAPWRWSWHRDLHFVTGAASRGKYEGQWP
jgi:glycosyltransferase involved in cell wall biosynthesis